MVFSDDFCGHGPLSEICQTCLQRDRCRRLRNILQLPVCDNLHKRLFLELFVEYVRQIFITSIFYDCSANLLEDWLPKLFNRTKLYIFELGNQSDENSDIGASLNSLLDLCKAILVHFGLHMTVYGCNFNSITLQSLHTSGVEIRFHYYLSLTIGRPLSPLTDESLHNVLIDRLHRSMSTGSDPHLLSSFLGSPQNDF